MTSAPHQESVAYASGGRRGAGPVSRRGLDLTAIWTLYALTLRQHLHGKRWIVLAVLFLLPAGLAVFLRTVSPDMSPIDLEFHLAFFFLPQGLLPLVALLYASGMIQDEQEEQTITYLLIRPIPKWALYLTKLTGTLTTTTALTMTFTALTYAAIYVGAGTQAAGAPMRCLKAASIHGLAVATYCCLFGLLSLLTNRALVMGILYALFIEGLIANMPFSVRLLTVIYYTRLIAYRTLTFIVPYHRGPRDIAAQAWQLDVNTDPQLLEHPSLSHCITTLVIASLACAILAAFLCSRREFHVKTPEKS